MDIVTRLFHLLIYTVNRIFLWLTNVGLTCDIMSESVIARLANHNLDRTITFHLPLHRILSNLLFLLHQRYQIKISVIKHFLESSITDVQRILELIIIHPIQLQYAISQSQIYEAAGPALATENSIIYRYSESYTGSSFIDCDRFLIQFLSSLYPKQTILTLLTRFKLTHDFFQSPSLLIRYLNDQVSEDDVKFSSPLHHELVEKFLVLITQLIVLPISLHPLSKEAFLKEASVILYAGECTFSKMQNALPALTRASKWNKALKQTLTGIADFHEPSVSNRKPKSGYFTLKEEIFSTFDPLFVIYRSTMRNDWYVKSMQNLTNWVKRMKPRIRDDYLKRMWPPIKPDLNFNDELISKCSSHLLESQHLHQFLLLILRCYLKDKNVSEMTLNMIVFLLEIALRLKKKNMENQHLVDNCENEVVKCANVKCVYSTDDIITNIFTNVADHEFSPNYSAEFSPCNATNPCSNCSSSLAHPLEQCAANTLMDAIAKTITDTFTQTCNMQSRSPSETKQEIQSFSIVGLVLKILIKHARVISNKSILNISDKELVLELLKNEHFVQVNSNVKLGSAVTHLCHLLRLIEETRVVAGVKESVFDHISELSNVAIQDLSSQVDGLNKKIDSEFANKQTMFMKYSSSSTVKSTINCDNEKQCCICRDLIGAQSFGVVGFRQWSDIASRQRIPSSVNDTSYNCEYMIRGEKILNAIYPNIRCKMFEYLKIRGENTLLSLFREQHKDHEKLLSKYNAITDVSRHGQITEEIRNKLKICDKVEDALLGASEVNFPTSTLVNRAVKNVTKLRPGIQTVYDVFPLMQCPMYALKKKGRKSETTKRRSTPEMTKEKKKKNLKTFDGKMNRNTNAIEAESLKGWPRIISCVQTYPAEFYVSLSNVDFSRYSSIISCGHYVHIDCVKEYLSSISRPYPKHRFKCSICGGYCDTVVPIVDEKCIDLTNIAENFIKDNSFEDIGGGKAFSIIRCQAKLIRGQIELNTMSERPMLSQRSSVNIIGYLFNLFRRVDLFEHDRFLYHCLVGESEKYNHMQHSSFLPILFYDPLMILIHLMLASFQPSEITLKHILQPIFQLSLVQSMIAIVLSGYTADILKNQSISECISGIYEMLSEVGFHIEAGKSLNMEFIVKSLQLKMLKSLAFVKISITNIGVENYERIDALRKDADWKSCNVQENYFPNLLAIFSGYCQFLQFSDDIFAVDDILFYASAWLKQLFSSNKQDKKLLAAVKSILMFQGFASRTLSKPTLMNLPERLDTLHEQVSHYLCPKCNQHPFKQLSEWPNMDIKMCLLCSAPYSLLPEPFCCQMTQEIKEKHDCHGCNGCGFILEMNTKNSMVIMGWDRNHVFEWGTLFVDENGEEDLDLTKGRPLFLNRDRQKFLESEWRNSGLLFDCFDYFNEVYNTV